MQGTDTLDETDNSCRGDLIGLTTAAVAQVFDVRPGDMHTRSRTPRAALARQVAMYLARVVLGMRILQIAAAFGREGSTVFHAVQHVEDLRDDPELDRTVLYLECLVRRAAEECT